MGNVESRVCRFGLLWRFPIYDCQAVDKLTFHWKNRSLLRFFKDEISVNANLYFLADPKGHREARVSPKGPGCAMTVDATV